MCKCMCLCASARACVCLCIHFTSQPIQDAEEQYEEVLELVLIFESDVKSLEQIIAKARNAMSDARAIPTPSNRRSFASEAWAVCNKV